MGFVVGLLPTELYVIVGEPLRVTCIIPDRLSDVYNSSQLAFDFYKEGRVKLLDNELITPINATAALLNYTVLSQDWDNALLGCYVNHSDVSAVRRVHIYSKCFCIFCCLVTLFIRLYFIDGNTFKPAIILVNLC